MNVRSELKHLIMPWRSFLPSLRLGFTSFEQLLDAGGLKSLVVCLVSLLVFWHIYTPIHELLHVGACLVSGGTVTELALKPQYGGLILAKIFPFVVAESDYAGQLTGFTTPNGFAYAFVDLAPYLLSLPGLAVIELARRGKRAWLFGPGMVLAYVGLMSIPGDFYECVSLMTTKLAENHIPGAPAGVLISDDVFLSWSKLAEAGQLDATIIGLILLGVLGAVYLSLMLLAAQVSLVRFWFGPEPLQFQTALPASNDKPS